MQEEEHYGVSGVRSHIAPPGRIEDRLMTTSSRSLFFALALAVAAVAPLAPQDGGGPQLDKLTLPDGFSIEVYAADVPNARQMSLSPNGTLFVSTRRLGNVYAVLDDDGDQAADRVLTLDSGLNMPNGVAFRDGDLYGRRGQPRPALRRHRGQSRYPVRAGGAERRVPVRPGARLGSSSPSARMDASTCRSAGPATCATTRRRRRSTPPSTA